MRIPTQFTTPAISRIFAEENVIAQLLRVEAALALAEGEIGVIPAGAAQAIATAAATLVVDQAQLARAVERDGFPIIELVRQLRAHVGGEAAEYVHWGATTQDIMDTALVLQLREALIMLQSQLLTLNPQLSALADTHRHTLMAGRTHSQQALPITFGLKVANWLAPLIRHHERLTQLLPRLLVVQLGGAAGTLASLGELGGQVQAGLARQLNLGVPPMPWHTQRDALVECAGWLSMLSGSLAKMAQDIILMAQSEVGELSESNDPARGGSSTMPQKSNPIISELIVAAARTNAGLLANMHNAMIHEHERATHGWQMEWLALPQMFGLTASALARAHFLASNLQVDVAQMHANVGASHGLMLAERLSFALAPVLGRARAKQVLRDACLTAARDGVHVVDALRAQINVALDWDALRDEAGYLGITQQLIDQVKIAEGKVAK